MRMRTLCFHVLALVCVCIGAYESATTHKFDGFGMANMILLIMLHEKE